MCTALVEHHPPCQWNFAIDRAQPLALAAYDWVMIRQIFNIMFKGVATIRSRELLVKLKEFDLVLREISLNYFGHVEHSSDAFSQHVINTLMEGAGKRGGGRWYENNWQRTTVMSGSSMCNSRSGREEQLTIMCEIFYSCSYLATCRQMWPMQMRFRSYFLQLILY